MNTKNAYKRSILYMAGGSVAFFSVYGIQSIIGIPETLVHLVFPMTACGLVVFIVSGIHNKGI